MLDLNDNRYLIANTLKLVMAQRLILKYCHFCNEKGCKECNFTKYYGRTSVAEILEINEDITSLILNKENIKEYLKKISFASILDDAHKKVDMNITSLDEVYKVL